MHNLNLCQCNSFRDIPQTDQISLPFHIKFVVDTQNQSKIYPVLDLPLF